MARQAGPNYFIGRIGDYIYFKLNGVYYVKRAPEEKKFTEQEKARKLEKEGCLEFAGGSVLGKAFRELFADAIGCFADSYSYNRITGVFSKVIKKGSGKEGMRSAEILKNRSSLIGFQFRSKNKFDCMFKSALKWEVRDRSDITLVVPSFISKSRIAKPKGASHFGLTVYAGILSDYVYSVEDKKYVPVNGSSDESVVSVFSGYIPLKESIDSIRLPLKINLPVPDSAGIVVCIGIQFYKEEGGVMYELQSKKAMMIAGVN